MQACVKLHLSETELKDLVLKAKDWNILHGCSMRSKENFSIDQAQICPFLLLPTSYPRREFQKAKEIQTVLNELMHKVAYDYEFLCNTLKSTIEVDYFTKKLFDIYQIVYSEGFAQDISLGLIRSDYMLHSTEGNKIKQVEINMISSSFAGLAGINSNYQKFILEELGQKDKLSNIPKNDSVLGFCSGLMEAWALYKNKKAVILFIVEDVVYNIFDQRAIEFQIHQLRSEIKIVRRSLSELTVKARLGPNKELLVDDFEVAVAYYRTGYQLEAYPSEKEWDVRLLIERSKAIKCPSIHYHLAGTKKVQQELAVPGVLERFYPAPAVAAQIKEIFMGLYSLDLNEDGDKAVALAMSDSKKYILKPQREGGGNNVYDDEIKKQLESMKDSKSRTAYILMERIYPPLQKNYLIRAGNTEVKLQDFVSELGIYGVLLGNQSSIFLNAEVGHVLRTKPSSDNEGGIVCGAGAIDNPYLVD